MREDLYDWFDRLRDLAHDRNEDYMVDHLEDFRESFEDGLTPLETLEEEEYYWSQEG